MGVRDGHGQFHRKDAPRLRIAPLHFHPTGGVRLHAVFGMRAVPAVDGESGAGSTEPADLVARDRVTAVRELHRGAFGAADDDGRAFSLFAQGADAVQERRREQLPEADLFEEFVFILHAEVAEHAFAQFRTEGCEVDPLFFGHGFQSGAAQRDAFFALTVSQVLTDFRSGFA